MSASESNQSSEYKFPTIDLTDWESNREAIASRIDSALRSTGFACYTNPPVDWDNISSCFGIFRAYFSRDMGWKEKQLVNYGIQKNGFMSTKFASVPWKKQSPDSKEFYKLYTNISMSEIETSTGESIPSSLQHMETIVNTFRTQTYTLIDIFLKLHSLALGQEQHWLSTLHGTHGTSIRFNHYPIVHDFTPTPDTPQQQSHETETTTTTLQSNPNDTTTTLQSNPNDTSALDPAAAVSALTGAAAAATGPNPVFIRNAAHTDLNSLTLLFLEANDPGGLQIWDSNAQIWRNMTFTKNSIIVNTGKMMVRWTNDVYHANIHRVVGTKQACQVDRYSIAVFITPERTTIIKPLVPKGDQPHYEDITVGAFVDTINKRTE